MQIPVLSGIYANGVADFRTSYPINLVPVPKEQGLSNGYLRPADGLIANGVGPGISRGGINWKGICYRVMGTSLVSVSSTGVVSILGDVGGVGRVTFDYSFDRLGIASGGKLFYFDGITLSKVVDVDIGNVIDFIWVDGYFLTTDGEFLVVTELNDPLAVNPLKYGSSEIDPDPIKAVVKLHNEVYAVNRYTIEVFVNVGTEFFPFQRIEGGQIQKGSTGTHSCCVFVDAIAFLGSGKNEAPGIYMAKNASVVKISTREIDEIIASYSEALLVDVVLETRNYKGHKHLWIRFHDQTLVYDSAASQVVGEPVWFHLTSAISGFSAYRAIDLVWAYDKWLISDSASSDVGYLTDTVSSHFGNIVRWEFGTVIAYNGSRGAIFHELELVCLPGRVAFGDDPQISTSYSIDGEVWSQDKSVKVGKRGERNKRIVWFQQGFMRNWRIQRFRGDSQAFISIARLEAQIEKLSA